MTPQEIIDWCFRVNALVSFYHDPDVGVTIYVAGYERTEAVTLEEAIHAMQEQMAVEGSLANDLPQLPIPDGFKYFRVS